MPASFALVLVSVLVLGIAGGGGYLAWRQTQVEPTVEAAAEPEPAPTPVEPPPVAVPEPVVPPPTPELPSAPPTTTPTTPSTPAPTKTGKTTKSDSGGTTSKKPPAGKADTGSKSGSGGVKKIDPVDDPLAKRKEQAEAADPGRVLVELEFLSAIDKSLKAGNWAQALAYVEQHDREMPGGQLVDKFDERRIRALCGMGRTSEAQSKVTQILAKRPASKVKAALAESCK